MDGTGAISGAVVVYGVEISGPWRGALVLAGGVRASPGF